MSKTKYNIRSTKDISDLILLWRLLCGHLTWGVGCPWALSPLQSSLCLLSSFMQAQVCRLNRCLVLSMFPWSAVCLQFTGS